MRGLRYLLNWQAPCSLNSAWQHNVAGCCIPQYFAEFCDDHGKAAGFAALTDQVARPVRHADVVATALDQGQRHPARAVLYRLNLPTHLVLLLRDPGVESARISHAMAAKSRAASRSTVTDAQATLSKAHAMRRAGQAATHAITKGCTSFHPSHIIFSAT